MELPRPLTVSNLKQKGNRGNNKQRRPREGTKLGNLYDLLVENAGETVSFHISDHKYAGPMIEQLKTFYGLDIRLVSKGGTKKGASIYILAGYWDGVTYIDCIAEKVKEPQWKPL